MSTLQVLRYLFGIPIIAGSVWALGRRGKPVEGRTAAALLLYGFLYIVAFHYWLKAF